MRELTVNEIEEVNGGLAPAALLGAYVVRYAVKKVAKAIANHNLTKTAVGGVGGTVAAGLGQALGEQ